MSILPDTTESQSDRSSTEDDSDENEDPLVLRLQQGIKLFKTNCEMFTIGWWFLLVFRHHFIITPTTINIFIIIIIITLIIITLIIIIIIIILCYQILVY